MRFDQVKMIEYSLIENDYEWKEIKKYLRPKKLKDTNKDDVVCK